MDNFTNDIEEITYSDLLRSFQEFVTVFFHSLLHQRALYPSPTFDVVTRFNVVLYQNRHPGVRDYINELVNQIIDHVSQGTVSRISFVILSTLETPLERYVIDVSQFPRVSKGEQEYIIDDLNFTWNELQQQYRAVLVRLATISPSFGKLPPYCTFTAMLETQHDDPALWNYESPWTLASRQDMKGKNRELTYQGQPQVWAVKSRPIRRVDAGLFSFSVWLEEGKSKDKLPS
ncbi:DNA-binding protein [Nadsonia fulvescens var. elongata DSM 6958]|uniref:DNA-binding protein n=1 Tax=Nadsonia fulvescens var. elongata DSM 6958 TaxID=857566 RepID=A0A1E3PFC1_9ASCO|nr:DNA-binding protein [Nadsonia fulvescens var. elongata DSM 6958]